jgi:hypothetical protein
MNNRPWIIWLTCVAVALIAVGIFFYYNMFRQSKSELIEAIPTDAAFILALNDNDGFVSGAKVLTPYLDELLVLDAMPAFQTIRKGLPAGEYDLTVSGHANNDGVSVLFNMHADKAAFKRLLRALSIDPNNHTTFEGARIYTYGTNFKSVKFTYVNHIITLSTDMELLKRAVVQYTHPKNLLSDKQFKEMYNLTEKNRKQNWLILNPKRYLSYFSSFMKEDASGKMSDALQNAGWTALQLRFSGNEMVLSGYMLTEDSTDSNISLFENRNGDGMTLTDVYPSQVNWYAHIETPNCRELRQVKSNTKEDKLFQNLNPGEVGYFSLRADSVDYTYLLVLADTSKNALEALYGDKADSVRAAHPDGIFPTPGNILPLAKAFAPDSLTCFVERTNALVFAPSQEAIKAYLNSMRSNGPLSQNRYHPFVNEAVASASVLNFVIFNNESPYWNDLLSEKGKASRFGKEMRIFSVSCETLDKANRLLPVNLYLLF